MFGKCYECLLLPFHCSLKQQRFIDSKNAIARNFREPVDFFLTTEPQDGQGNLLEGPWKPLVPPALSVGQINTHAHVSLIVVSHRIKLIDKQYDFQIQLLGWSLWNTLLLEKGFSYQKRLGGYNITHLSFYKCIPRGLECTSGHTGNEGQSQD